MLVSDLLATRFCNRGASEDLDGVITCLRRVRRLSGTNDPYLLYSLLGLGFFLTKRFDQSGERSDLDEAITNYRRATELTPVSHIDLPSWLNNLAKSLTSRYARYGEDVDLAQAIATFRQAIELTPAGHSDLPVRLNNLALSLSLRFTRYGKDADLEEAIINYQLAIELIPVGQSELPLLLNGLAFSLKSRYIRYGDDSDLEQAIMNYREAIKLTPANHGDLPSWLGNLAGSLVARFLRYGEDANLEQAITNYRQAIKLTPSGHSDLPGRLNNMALSLELRFSRYGEDVDLEQAITNSRQSIKLTPVGHSELPTFLNNLGLSLASKFDRYGEDADIEQAIVNYRHAIELTQVNHGNLPLWLNSLANSLGSRYVRYKDDADLDQAIINYRRAIELTPAEHSGLPMFLNNLAFSLASRFDHCGEDADLEEAIATYCQAIELAPVDHHYLPLWLNNLGNSLASRFTRYGKDTDLNEAILVDAKGSKATSGVIHSRFECAVHGAALAHSSGQLAEALKAYNIAGFLLPQRIWFGQSVASRQRSLRFKPASLASDAAACAISLGFLERVVELLDHGRSLFWSKAMDIRTSSNDLKNLDASLADEFESTARALDVGAFQDRDSDYSTVLGRDSVVDNTERRRGLAEQLERLLIRIRKLPSFEHFMEPLPYSRLRHAAAGGPVIILNVSSYRCDALIVTVNLPPKLVPLPDMSLELASDLAANIRKHRIRQGEDPQAFRSCLKAVLPELWRIAVLPVLNALGCNDLPDKSHSKSRIWWCPTGPLSFLPIHAAGPYTKSGGPDLSRRVVSSYTNTLSALLRARSQPRSTESCRMLLIGQSETPGQKPLLSATKDLDVICEKARVHGVVDITRLEGSDAVQATILEKLSNATCAHFACHGHQDQTQNGLISALRVHDGPLLLSTLASRQLSYADFAFLSACHSASGSDDMPDEAMHIAAGMQVAGFRSVIATMWGMDDSTGPFVAEKVYDRLLRNASDKFDSTEAAAALNNAVRALRKVKDQNGNSVHDVDQWVPFIHIGV
jgi:tetratricopeptide (TPR) repeat protein